MSWARVDDAWWSHRKVIGLDLEARGLWVSGLSYTCHQRSSHIPAAVVTMMGGNREIAGRLVEAGLWREDGDGWTFHDWDEYQSTSAKRAEAGRKGGEKSGEARRSKQIEANSEANEAPESKQAHPIPSQPIPTQSQPSPNGAGGRQANPLWDAVVAACGWQGERLTKSQQGKTAAAVKELRDIGATPDEVTRRAANYRNKYAGMDLTPNALAANWASLGTTAPPKPEPGKVASIGTGGIYL
jgi:hypothetical protein